MYEKNGPRAFSDELTKLSFCMFAFSLPLEVQISDIIPWSVVAQIMKKSPAFSEPEI